MGPLPDMVPGERLRVRAIRYRNHRRRYSVAVLRAGFSLTGGGALIRGYGSYGVMLTQCGPAKIDGVWTGWTAEGKDHMKEDALSITAWAITRTGAITALDAVKSAAAGHQISPSSQSPATNTR